MLGRTNATIGGDGRLNFSVKTYTDINSMMADTPTDNTIGIATTEYVDYVMSPYQPAGSRGLLWIDTASETSRTGFVHLKPFPKKEIYVDVFRCLLYSDSWSLVGAGIYQNGAWVMFKRVIYDTGATYEPFTAGASGSTKVTLGTQYISCSPQGAFGIITNNKFDLTNYTNICAEVWTETGSSQTKGIVGYVDDTDKAKTNQYPSASAQVFTGRASHDLTGSKAWVEIRYDCSAIVGLFYPKVAIYRYNTVHNSRIRKLWLE